MPTRRDPPRDAEDLPDLEDDLDLPPADDDEGDPVADEDDDELDALDEEGLDDEDAADLDVGGDDLELDETAGEDAEDEVDVGPLDEGIDIDEEDGDDAEGTSDGDAAIDDDDTSEDDGGAEGTSEDPGDEIDEGALPDLDDDDGAEGDGDALADELLAESEGGASRAAGWVLIEGAGAPLPCVAVATAAGRVAAAGEVLLVVDDGARAARRLALGEGWVAVALGDDALLAATVRGQLLLARGSGEDASALGSWRAGAETSLGLWPVESGSPAVELTATPGRFWIRAGAALLSVASPAQPLAAVRERGVLAITASAGVLVAITLGDGGPSIARFRNDDEGWHEAPLTGDARRVVERARAEVRVTAAAAGRAVALTDRRAVAISRDGGVTWLSLEIDASAITFAGDGPDAPLLAVVPPPDGDTTVGARLCEITAEGAIHVAELGGRADDGGKPREAAWERAALAWDGSREMVWITCGAGLLALGKPQRH